MNFAKLISMTGHLEWFDLATIVQLTGERRGTIINQLYRWNKAGKIIALRRGMYMFEKMYRKSAVQPASIANAMYRPSYLTGAWALSFYGMIPESVHVYTSVTTRTPRVFDNNLGLFQYRNIKKAMFFGYVPITISGCKVLIATAEKALVDFWYLTNGKWTVNRMREMRFSLDVKIDAGVIEEIVKKSGKPRIQKALDVWRKMSNALEGAIEI